MHEWVTVDSLSDGIRHAIHHAANTVLPKSTFNKHTKPYWTSEVKNAHSKSRQMRATWIANGRPRCRANIYFRNYKEAKSQFRKIQRIESEKYMDNVYNDLDEAAELDYRLFWKLLRNRKTVKKIPCKEIAVKEIIHSTPEALPRVLLNITKTYSTIVKIMIRKRFSLTLSLRLIDCRIPRS